MVVVHPAGITRLRIKAALAVYRLAQDGQGFSSHTLHACRFATKILGFHLYSSFGGQCKTFTITVFSDNPVLALRHAFPRSSLTTSQVKALDNRIVQLLDLGTSTSALLLRQSKSICTATSDIQSEVLSDFLGYACSELMETSCKVPLNLAGYYLQSWKLRSNAVLTDLALPINLVLVQTVKEVIQPSLQHPVRPHAYASAGKSALHLRLADRCSSLAQWCSDHLVLMIDVSFTTAFIACIFPHCSHTHLEGGGQKRGVDTLCSQHISDDDFRMYVRGFFFLAAPSISTLERADKKGSRK